MLPNWAGSFIQGMWELMILNRTHPPSTLTQHSPNVHIVSLHNQKTYYLPIVLHLFVPGYFDLN